MFLEYYRPSRLAEALFLLGRSTPLALPLGGGTFISHHEHRDCALVDLQLLSLNFIQVDQSQITIGGTTRLEQINLDPRIPVDLCKAIQHEAGLNMRQMMTLMGTLTTADGDSPLAITLLAMGARITVEPDHVELPLGDWFPLRGEGMRGKLATQLSIPKLLTIACEWVARTPFDRPILWVALGKTPSGNLSCAVNQPGSYPLLITSSGEPSSLGAEVSTALQTGADPLAPTTYRSHCARVLTKRLISRDVE